MTDIRVRVTTDCPACREALELDRVTIVRLGTGEIALLACPEHLNRMLLAIETLEGLERTLIETGVLGEPLPPLPQALVNDRTIVRPEITP
jgi:hypothetical protein